MSVTAQYLSGRCLRRWLPVDNSQGGKSVGDAGVSRRRLLINASRHVVVGETTPASRRLFGNRRWTRYTEQRTGWVVSREQGPLFPGPLSPKPNGSQTRRTGSLSFDIVL